MREILFRGKRFDTKDWIYGSLLEDDVIVAKGATDVDEDYIGFSDDWSSVLPDTVGQYTGLTDKNGVKIFEGDIVSFDFPEDGIYCKGKCTGTVIFEKLRYTTDCCMLNWIDKRFEVIGNIHDTAEGHT